MTESSQPPEGGGAQAPPSTGIPWTGLPASQARLPAPVAPRGPGGIIGRLDPGLLICLGLVVVAAWPFLVRPSLPVMTDAEMHVYRAAEILDALRSGVLYTRWAPDFYYGYGYPVFNYYSPLTYYLAAVYALLSGTGPVAGIKFVFVLGYLLGGCGMYLFVRDRWGGIAGLVATTAFLFSPYLIFIDPHARGDAPEFFALAAAPLLFWAFSRLRRTGSPGDTALAAVILAVVVLSHPLMALVILGLLLFWAAWDWFLGHGLLVAKESPRSAARPWQMMLLALSLGLGAAAFLWIPAALERSAVQLHNVAGPGFFDFHRNFVSLKETLAPSQFFDLGATEVRFHFNLGLAQWILAALGALTVFPRRTRRLSAVFFTLAALLTVYLILPSSSQVWEAIPPMSFIQFPSRFLGPSALLFAVLAGAAVTWGALGRWKWSSLALGLTATLALLALALPLLSPPQWGEFGPVNPRRMLQVELDGRSRGTTSGDDFLPVSVLQVPGPQDSLIESYERGMVDKVNRATLPPGAQVESLYHGPLEDRFSVNSPEPFVFRLYTFYFPGWRATVDGVPVPIEPANPDGFITFQVPAGAHPVRVKLEDTLPRRLGWIMSGISWLSILGLLAVRSRRRQEAFSPTSPPLEKGAAISFAILVFAFGVFRAVSDRGGWFVYHSADDRVVVAQVLEYASMDGQIAFLGYDLPVRKIHAGDDLPVVLYWKRIGEVKENYQVFVHLIGPDGILYGQSDELNPAGFPTTRWPSDRYVRDEHEAQLSPDMPPGTYVVQAGLWLQIPGIRLNAWTADGIWLGQQVQLANTIEVLP